MKILFKRDDDIEMKLIDLTCNKCGAQLKANADLKKCSCNYCGNEMLIDDEVIHHQIDNAFDAGYQAEIGRQQAQFKTTLQQARNAIEIGDYTASYRLYSQLIKDYPTNKEIIFFTSYLRYINDINLVYLQVNMNELREAINKIQKLIDKDTEVEEIKETMLVLKQMILTLTELYLHNKANLCLEAHLEFVGDLLYKVSIICINYANTLTNEEYANKLYALIINNVLSIDVKPYLFNYNQLCEKLGIEASQSKVRDMQNSIKDKSPHAAFAVESIGLVLNILWVFNKNSDIIAGLTGAADYLFVYVGFVLAALTYKCKLRTIAMILAIINIIISISMLST